MNSTVNLKLSVPRKIVLIGASTGGPGQIQKIVNALPKLENTSIIIAQHMVQGFMSSFTSRLQNSHHNSIQLIQDNEKLDISTIYICEGETTVNLNASCLLFSCKPSSKNSYSPDINTLFNSFIAFSKNINILTVILTGIGDDGVEACVQLSKNGVRCITESESSAIVDGMPSRARAAVENIEAYEIQEIIKIVSEFCE